MKYKHESTIKNVAMFAFVLTMILMKVTNISVQTFIGAISCIGCTLGGIYFSYKGSKKGFKMAGAFMFYIALGVFLGILSSYFKSYNSAISYDIAIPIPSTLILFFIFGQKVIVMYGDEEKIKQMKKLSFIGIVLCSIIQIVMIIILFIK